MSDENKINGDGKKNPEMRIPPKTWVVWTAIAAVIAVLILAKYQIGPQPETMLAADFQKRMEANPAQFSEVTYNYNQQTLPIGEIVGSYYPVDEKGVVLTNKGAIKFQTQVLMSDPMQDRLQKLPNFKTHATNTFLAG